MTAPSVVEVPLREMDRAATVRMNRGRRRRAVPQALCRVALMIIVDAIDFVRPQPAHARASDQAW